MTGPRNGNGSDMTGTFAECGAAYFLAMTRAWGRTEQKLATIKTIYRRSYLWSS